MPAIHAWASVWKGRTGQFRSAPNRRCPMTKTPRIPTTDKPNLTLASSTNLRVVTPIKPKVSKVAALPAATFSPEALTALLNEVTETRKALADQKAELDALKTKAVY